ncbi:hypothetical protein AVEN_149784-1 [Araneus ventricosus]|uniref:Uncharacterized protein n=1 Tax=Araneus ventricosus TaxID=182803 RepID=A0A4Y2K9S3_ARAVE|nr:hypothetical protein AVEN_149784-1 [Araneus ventricosus]
MSKHSRARRHHPLSVTDPRYATPTTTQLGQVKTPPFQAATPTPTPMGPRNLDLEIAKYNHTATAEGRHTKKKRKDKHQLERVAQ